MVREDSKMALIGRRYVSLEVRNKRQPRVGKKNPNPSKRLVDRQRFLPCWVLPALVGPAGAERGHGEPRDSGTRLRAALIHTPAPELLQHCPDRPVSGTPCSRELSSQTQQLLPTDTGFPRRAAPIRASSPRRAPRPAVPPRGRASPSGPKPGCPRRSRASELSASPRSPRLAARPYLVVGDLWARVGCGDGGSGGGRELPGRAAAEPRSEPRHPQHRCAAPRPAPPCRSARPRRCPVPLRPATPPPSAPSRVGAARPGFGSARLHRPTLV